MKIPRSVIGKMAEVTWRDPCQVNVKSHTADRSDVPKGMAALAIQKEYGAIDDVTDGVLRIVHSWGQDSPLVRDDRSDDFRLTYVHEALIEKVVYYEPMKEEVPSEQKSL